MKKYSRFLSILVLLAITAGCIPFSAFAEEPLITPDTIEDTKIVEVVERREESIKHFRLPDGSYEAVSYAGPVHRKDANGVWRDIDNDLTLKTVGTKQLYTTDDSRLSFAKEYSSGSELVSINENGYVISMSMLQRQDEAISTAPMTSTVINSNYVRPNSFDTMEEAINIENKSSIAYSNVNSNTDIEYIMQGNDLKENIIVKSKGERYEYGFQLALVGLNATLDESGAIYLCDKESEEIKYIIPAPYMYDAEGEYSEDVSYSLFNVEGDKYLLVVTADEEWMNDTERTFPVTIDPSVVSGSSGVSDAYISTSNVDSKYGGSYKVRISSSQIALINVQLPSIHTATSGGIFEYANLYVNYYGDRTYGAATVGVYEILSSWDENTVTYNTAPSISTTQISYASMLTSTDMTDQNTSIGIFSVTDAVKDYYSHDAAFYGVSLQRTYGDAHIVIRSHESSSSEAAYIRVHYSSLENGNYFIRNKELGNYIQIDDNTSPNYNTTNSIMELWNLAGDDGNYQKWQIEHVSNGYYKIISAKSGLALSVQPNYVNSSGKSLVQLSYSGSSTQLWEISRSVTDNYIIRPKSGESYSTNWCMCAGSGLFTSDGRNVEQKAYSKNSDYKDEWVLAKIMIVHNDVTLEGQYSKAWCWATAARMFAKHYGTVSIGQSAAVNLVFPNLSEDDLLKQGGDCLDAQKAINHYLGLPVDENLNYLGLVTTANENTLYTKAELIKILEKGGVIYISRGIHYVDSEGKNAYQGHATLIYGYVTINSVCYFLIRDPLLPEDVENIPDTQYVINSTGYTYLMSYQKLCNGQNALADETPDLIMWDGAVVHSQHLPIEED